jgi:hypothetical protein
VTHRAALAVIVAAFMAGAQAPAPGPVVGGGPGGSGASIIAIGPAAKAPVYFPGSGGGGAPAVPPNSSPPIQSNTGGGTGGSTGNSQPFTTHVTSGNVLVLYVMDATDQTTNINSIGWTGGGANCGNLIATPLSPINGSTRRMWVYTAQITASDCTGVIVAFSASINSIVIFAEYAGLATSSVIDKEIAGSATGTAITSGTVATTNQYDTLVGGIFITSAGGGTLTAGASFTSRVNSANARMLEDRDVNATGSYAATATYSSSQSYIAHLLALKRGASSVVVATNFYLAAAADGGSDGNDGLTPATPWLSPNHSMNCGDVITAKASTAYAAVNFASNKWGTVTCPSGDKVAWLKCETFNGCKISASNTFAMYINKSYWGVQGWETTGTGNNGVCYGVSPTGGATIHHIILANNVARSCANGFSIFNQSSTVSVDYVALIGNIAWNAAQSTSLCNSGFTIYEPIKSDSVAGTHIYIAGNFSFDNSTPTNCLGGSGTYDGEGINLDDIGNVQSGGVAYNQQIVVEHNLAVWNGGFGFANGGNGTRVAPIVYRYNTSVHNLTATNTDMTTCGDLTLLDSSLTVITRNLIMTGAATGCKAPGGSLYAVAVNGADATVTVSDNWLYSATGSHTTALSSPGFSFGSNTTGTNPSFASPVDPGNPNCSGKASVPDCMATVLANYTPANVSAQAYGVQPVTGPQAPDGYFPPWLCNVNLPTGLITMRCS